MSDYIKRESFTEHIEDLFCKQCERRIGIKNVKKKVLYAIGDTPCRSCGIADVMESFEVFPAADVVERKHGKWIPIPDKDAPYYEKSDWIGCSECRQYAHYTRISDKPILSNFCPNCGADMRGDNGACSADETSEKVKEDE